MKVSGLPSKITVCAILLLGCIHVSVAGTEQNSTAHADAATDYPGVPKSSVYEVTVTEGNASRQLVVFQSSCPEYQPGHMNMSPVDQHPLKLFQGRSISWADFSFSNRVTIQVRVLDPKKASFDGPVKILPARYGLKPLVNGNVVSFVLTKPGQCSVEIGNDGHKNGLLIFANPPETNQPDAATGNYYAPTHATPAEISSVPAACSGIYFKRVKTKFTFARIKARKRTALICLILSLTAPSC